MDDDRAVPSWLALSSPAQDRPLIPAVERIARHLRAAASSMPESPELDFEALYTPRRPGLGFTLDPEQCHARASWALLGEWLVAFAVGQHDGTASVFDSHDWFWNGDGSNRLGRWGAGPVLPKGMSSPREVHALLPYLLDPSSVATRRNVKQQRATGDERASRKKSGIYYTPGDVAAHMVRKLVTPDLSTPSTWLDPAQGSGVFLRAVQALAPDYQTARDQLYGVDIDPFAAEAAAFVLTAQDILMEPCGEPPQERWHRFRRNLATGNSLFLGKLPSAASGESGPWRISEAFPEIGDGKFSRVIANPPYVKLPQHQHNASLSSLHPVTGANASADISPVFVELALTMLEDGGSMSIVLPLSIVASSRSPFPQLRSHLQRMTGELSIESFDRVPDALFGDDIKTRNAIVTLKGGIPAAFNSTPLHRWTSRKRELAFCGVPRVDISGLPHVPKVIPKIGTEWERALYKTCLEYPATIGSWVLRRRSLPLGRVQAVDSPHWSQVVALAPTAYNFLGLTRDATQAQADGHNSENAVALLSFSTARQASAAYAVMASRLAFWLWHVTGDGFHTTSRVPLFLPAPLNEAVLERLADLGEELWARARSRPLVSVNRGRTTVSYPTWNFGSIIAEIDDLMDEFLGVDVADRLAEWHHRLVVVDPDSDRIEMVKRKTE